MNLAVWARRRVLVTVKTGGGANGYFLVAGEVWGEIVLPWNLISEVPLPFVFERSRERGDLEM